MRRLKRIFAKFSTLKRSLESTRLIEIKTGNRREWISPSEFIERQKISYLTGAIYGTKSKDRNLTILQVSTFSR